MRVKPFLRPINRPRFSTLWITGTGEPVGLKTKVSAVALFLAASGAALGIGFREPLLESVYEFIVCILAVLWCLGPRQRAMPPIPCFALTGIGLWGFFQLALGATVYRFPTLQASLRFAALGATAWVSFRVFGSVGLRVDFLRSFAWLGTALAVISVLAYFTSPGQILWIFPAPYPDIWGPFLSRNNFAQFLELAMPVALWLALRETSMVYLSFAAVMLAAGLASASRAGACTLVLEATVLVWMERKSLHAKRMFAGLALATILFAAMPGVGTLAARLREPDPFQDRKEIAHSAVRMISNRPWAGYGLGTFSSMYPAYATFDVGQTVEHAHNDWLEWTSEGGIIFSSLWIALALWAVGPALHTGWGVGVLGCFLHAVVDYPFARFGISAWVFILLGMLAATNLREVRPRAH
jgi:O-antigen ligase